MKRFAIILLVIAAIGAGWFLYSRASDDAGSTLPEGITTATVQRDTFEAAVSATGSVRAERSQRLSFDITGRVVEIMVAEGDEVSAGQVLARLDDATLALNLEQANAALTVAEAQLARTKAGPSDEDIAVAEAAQEIAEVGVQTAQAGVAVSQANLNRVRSGAAPEEIAIAERRVDEAKNALWGVQAQRDAICGRVGFAASEADCDQADANAFRSEESVRIAELQLQQIQSGARPEDVAGAQAQLEQALGQLENARAQVARAEAEFTRATRGALAEDIAIAEAQVAQARVNVDIAQSRFDDVELTAPADGRIATMNLYVGDTVAPGNPVITLVNTDRYHIIVNIDETEIGQVDYGQEVRVMLDAYPGQPVSGRVSSISLTGADVQGIVVYEVRVDIEETDLAIRPLMTASVDIVVARRDDALLVSSRALRRDEQGLYVEVLVNNQLERVPVQVGISNVEFTEILDGLTEGQQVVVSRPRQNLFDIPFGGG